MFAWKVYPAENIDSTLVMLWYLLTEGDKISLALLRSIYILIQF